MKTKFIIDGSSVQVFKMNEDTALDVLPPRVYTLRFHKMMGYYLDITKDQLEIPTKIYGDTPKRVDKCLYTYNDRPTSTGILLTGDKGTGKTLLMSLLANKVIKKLQLPVILIKDAYQGSPFISFIESIGECCLVFDEFGKMYTATDHNHNENDVSQKALLSLLDGVDKTKRLIIMTENREMDVNEFMLNRPSRIYYHFKYNKLDEASIIGYCEDNGVSQSISTDIVEMSRRSRIFSFDMLQSIVEEHLRFNEEIVDVIDTLNVDVRENFSNLIEIIKVIEKGSGEEREVSGSSIIPKPDRYSYIKLKNSSSNDSTPPVRGHDEDDDDYDNINISSKDIAYELGGKIVYETDNYTIVAKEVPTIQTSYSLLF